MKKPINQVTSEELKAILRDFLKEKGKLKPFVKYLKTYEKSGMDTGAVIKEFLEFVGERDSFNKYLNQRYISSK